MNKQIAMIFAAFMMIGFAGLTLAAGDKMLTIEGSTTVGPIGDAFAEYLKENNSDINITVNKTGSGDGATALIEGRCDIAMMSRFMKASEYEKAIKNNVLPTVHVVGMDGIAVVVHPSNPVSGLTIDQIRDIYMGKVANWKEVGGANMPIVVISRDASSGTYEVFNEKIMRGEKLGKTIEYVKHNPQAYSLVRDTRGAIGYIGMGFLNSKVKALKVNGVAPSASTISKGTYPISRPLYLFTNGYPEMGSLTYQFCTLHYSEDGHEIIEDEGYIPLTEY